MCYLYYKFEGGRKAAGKLSAECDELVIVDNDIEILQSDETTKTIDGMYLF